VRIEELSFERYGMFTDRKLSFDPEAALHVVLGANEAGKTSALSAIGDLLFGFGARTDYDFKHDSKILRIGGSFRHSDGRVITARRRKGNKNTLVDGGDQPLPDDSFASILGGLSRDNFIREFGLTAKALREGGEDLLSAGGRLGETLAASSAGMAELSRIKERLKAEADSLFTPARSANKPFYLVAKQRETADKVLRDATVTRDALQQLEAAVQEAHAHLEALNAVHAESGGTLARWQRTLRVRSQLVRLESLNVELVALGDLPPVSAQSLSEWRSAVEADAALQHEIAALDATGAAEAAEISAMAVDERLLSEGIAIDALRERLGAVRKAIDDIPRRRQARDIAEATLDESARRLGFASHLLLLERLPTDLALAHARDLIEQTKRAEQAILDADARLLRAQQERDEIAAEEGESDAVTDVEPLRQRFDALGDIPAQADRLRRDSAELSTETHGLEAAVASLDPSPAALDGLRALPLPESAVIAKYAHAAELSEPEVKRLGDAIAAADGAIATTEAELVRLSSAGAVPTRIDLIAGRRERDTHLEGLRAALDGDRNLRATEFSAVVRSFLAIDSITDLLLIDTERATRHEDAQLRLAETRSQRDRDAAKLASLQVRLSEVDGAWKRNWAASGLTPRGPAEMLRWRERLDDILARVDKLDAKKAAINAIVASLECGKAAVISFLDSVGRVPDRTMPPEFLFREAKARFDELQAAWADAKARSVAKRRIERDLTEAVAAREMAQAAHVGQREAWPAAVANIGLTGAVTLAQAEAALSVWQSVAVPKASHERDGRSVETMEADLHAFEHDVSDVLDRVAPELKSEPAQESLMQLSAKLTVARSASESCRRLRELAGKRVENRNVLIGRREALAAVLEKACQTLAVGDIASLPGLIERLTARQRYKDDQASLRRDLYEIADGRDEDALKQEREGLDLDQLPGDIAREAMRQEQLLKDISGGSASHHQKRVELNALMKGRDAVAAAAKHAEASAELLSIVERWLLRTAASRLAGRAIERHRAMVQDPLIARASALFAIATGGAFTGLGIDYGDDDQPVLIARRTDGEQVQVAGLSEGTRDQLFLAMRLALLERRTSEQIPFIGDDLLTSFDDDRTLATLRLLAAAGKQRQIILFTHHRHVADLAQSVHEHMVDVVHL
jgi:chromosome segregation protein